MKINSFKIKDRLLHRNKLDPLLPQNQDFQKKDYHEAHPLNSDYKFDAFMEKFQQFMSLHSIKNMQSNQKQHVKFNRHNLQSDCRDRFVLIDLPEFKNNQVQLQSLEIWIGELSKEILSVTFNFYSTGKFTYEQSKVYASESFLRNICRLAERYDIKKQELRFIDKKMKQEIFPYLKTKYPMTNEKDLNKSLQKVIKDINNIEVLTNDFFYYTNIEFQYRENGRYDDLIMRLLNQIMNKVNQNSSNTKGKNQQTNFKDFQSFMTNIFQKTYDESWMNTKNFEAQKLKEITQNKQQRITNTAKSEKKIRKRQSLLRDQDVKDEFQIQIKDEAERQKYKLSVQEYTNFQIGRKISENTQSFSQDEIQRKFLTIKSPAVLRILTKWCDQLWEKFSNQNYFIERTEGIRMQKGNQINIVYHWLKVKLKDEMKLEKQNILKFMQEIQEVHYSQQMLLLKNQLQHVSALHIDKLQRVTGKFSCKVVNNLENFTIVYLNRLIHGLTTVSKNCFPQLCRKPSWPFPPNLISFKIGDLMRCKFSSKQREVLKIFQQIQRVNNDEPQKLKIIRIKNRLMLGTNDVLLNVRFNNMITCQIQLAVSSVKTQFINCSYNFSHYVYELQRSFFGPITEFCSIWKNLQNRSKQFKKLIEKEPRKKQTEMIQNTICHKLHQSHKLIDNDMPFVCFECGKAYYQNNYMISHMKCSKCAYWKCGNCQILQNKESKNKQFFLQNQTLNSNSSFSEPDVISQYGVCIYIKKKPLQAIVFKKINYRQKDYLFKKNQQQNKVELMRQIGALKQVKTFFRQCVVFSLPQNIGKTYIDVNINLAKQQFIIPSYIDKCFKHQKQTISILGEQLSAVKLDVMQKASKQNKKCIKYIQFSSTLLSNMDLISEDFQNLDCLNLNLNKISDISKIVKFPKLQKLYIIQNLIKQIPQEIHILTKIKQINFFKNQIKELPSNFTMLKSLVSLKIDNNKLQSLPQKFYQLQSLKYFMANRNKLSEFPVSLCKHKKIQFIYLGQNKISVMPEQIEELGQLKQLNLQNNLLKVFPKKMSKMKKLQKAQFSYNKIQQLSKSINDWTGLVHLGLAANLIKNPLFDSQIQNLKSFSKLELNNNQIEQMNDSFNHLKFLQVLRLENNKINKLSQQGFSLQQLREIDLSFNKIEHIYPTSFKKCKKLQNLSLNNNLLQKLPNQFQNLKKLETFSLSRNNLSSFPKSFINLTSLKIINLTNFKIQLIPQDIGNMKGVKQLYLGQNLIQKIPDSLGDLQLLGILFLNHNKIEQINNCIFRLTNLEELSIQVNLIVNLPDKFQTLKKLKKLYISQNAIKSIPKSITDLENLVDFKFNLNPLQVLSSKLLKSNDNQINIQRNQIQLIEGSGESLQKQKQKITILKLKNNKFEYIPQVLFMFPNIIEIDLAENLLKQVPKQISTWKNLKILNLQKNFIEYLPQQIGSLQQLSILNLKCQTLKMIPKSMQKLKLNRVFLLGSKLSQISNLNCIYADIVDFSNQELTYLSQNLGDLMNVQRLNLVKNSLYKLPESVGKLVLLIQLVVYSQKLKALPQSIGNLINLKLLDVHQNQIEYVPDSIGNLLKLQTLQLSTNCLQQLPFSIKNLNSLKFINISKNQFEQVPSCLFDLKLKHLNMNANKIKQIPLQLCALQSIQQLYMSNNLIKKIPKQIDKMKNLKPKSLLLNQNPIQQNQSYNFVLLK